MQRVGNERGATAVVAAIVLTVLVGFGALAVDVGALWWDAKRLQNGADAAALALAQSCAGTGCRDEASERAVAGMLGTGNKGDSAFEAAADIRIDHGTAGPNSVTVTLSSDREHWLAQVLDTDSTDVTRSATAAWSGTPSSMSTIPFTLSYCQFAWQNGGAESGTPVPGQDVIMKSQSNWQSVPGHSEKIVCGARGAHNEAPGNFGFLEAGATCDVVTEAGEPVQSAQGNRLDGCTADQIRRIMGTEAGKVVPIPLFDHTNGLNGANTQYYITGYAGVRIQDYCLRGKEGQVAPVGSCTDANFISGTLVGYGALDEWLESDGGAVDYGVTSVRLTLNSDGNDE